MTLQHRDEVAPEGTGTPTTLRNVIHLVPTQSPGEHDALPGARPRPGHPPEVTPDDPTDSPTGSPTDSPADSLPLVAPTWGVPSTRAEWVAPQPGRLVSAGLLLVALAGTGSLGWRYYGSGTSGDLTALVVGLAVVVVLWGMTVTATPQVVAVRGTVLTVFSGHHEERYDLADLHQRVDLTGEPGSASWALVLHRRDRSARVLRSADVDAVVLDGLVRQHRDRAAQRAADRERRFTR